MYGLLAAFIGGMIGAYMFHNIFVALFFGISFGMIIDKLTSVEQN